MIIELLYNLDLRILHLFNVDWASPEMDQVWLALTHLDRQWWVIFGVVPFLLGRLLYIYGWSVFRMLFVLVLAVGITDALAYRVVKRAVDRPRPSQNSALSWVRRVDDAHGPSFPSNHAANCFAGAAVLGWYFRNRRHYFYALAALVGASRVAVGVHYPSDVLAGAILGMTVGYLVIIGLLSRTTVFRLAKRAPSSDAGDAEWRIRNRRLPDV